MMMTSFIFIVFSFFVKNSPFCQNLKKKPIYFIRKNKNEVTKNLYKLCSAFVHLFVRNCTNLLHVQEENQQR